MATEQELERTFLARHIPSQISGARSKQITDTYLPETAAHPLMRLRDSGGTYELTKKVPLSGTDSTNQLEHTIPLDTTEYEVFRTLSQKTVTKRRYYCTFYGRAAEVDVFMGGLKGLVLIDFEFSDEAAMRSFTPPEVCLADVSQEAFVAGGVLAGKAYDDIASQLLTYNYEPLYEEEGEKL